MGRRINISTPTVINTELVPLDESFYLEYDGQLEQWYYDNTEQYAPNRKVTPLLLSPRISAFDKDTATSYSPTFATTQWYAKEWNEQQQKYVETLITNNVDSASADYVIQGDNLLVKKNVSYSHAVSIRCLASYIDPRDSGVTYTVEDSVNLTTNRTADVVFPEVDIISPSGRSYNPLVDDENSQYDFLGVKTNNPVQPLTTDIRRYGVDVDGTEEILNSGEAVAPIMDIHYGDNPTMADQEFMYRQTAGGTLVGESIDKAYIERIKGNTVAWNQLIKNGNFSEGISYWRLLSEGTLQNPTNNVLRVTWTAQYDNNGFTSDAFRYTIGHKYLYYLSVKNLSETTRNIFVGQAYDVETRCNTNIQSNESANIKFVTNATVHNSGSGYLYFAIGTTTKNIETTVDVSNVNVIDLTLIYGAGKEPTTVEDFEADYQKWFGKPLTYEEYDAGSLRPVLMNAIQTKGENNSWTKVQEIPITTLKGKLEGAGKSVTIFPDGMKKAGSVHDEIKVEDGVIKAIKRVGCVDLGKRNWAIANNTTFFCDMSGSPHRKFDVVCHKYVTSSAASFQVLSDKTVIGYGDTVQYNFTRLAIRDDSYTDAATFRAAQNGVMLYYELATPQTYILDPITDFVWYGIKDNQEVLADTLPWYVSGQGTDKLTVDAMYGEYINVVLRCKMMDGETLSPSKAYASLSWRTPDIEPFVQSDNGGAVRSDTEEMTFGTIININGEVLSDALKRKHLAFKWKIHKNNAAPNLPESEVYKGWGQRITIDASDLRNVKQTPSSTLASTLVSNDVYLKGAYEGVTDNGVEVTDNGETVYDRPID